MGRRRSKYIDYSGEPARASVQYVRARDILDRNQADVILTGFYRIVAVEIMNKQLSIVRTPTVVLQMYMCKTSLAFWYKMTRRKGRLLLEDVVDGMY